LYHGTLLSAAGAYLRAMDAQTGAIRWRTPMRGEIAQCMGVPGIVDVDGVPHVISIEGWNMATNAVEILRLSDGESVGNLPGVTTVKGDIMGSVYTLSDGTIVNYLGTKGNYGDMKLVGWNLSLEPTGHVTARERWRSERGKYFTLLRAAWRGTDIYSQWNVLDGTTGQFVTEQRMGQAMRPPSGSHYWAFLLTEHHYVQCLLSTGQFVFWELGTGKMVGTGSLPVNPHDGLPTETIAGNEGRLTWRWLGGATPFAYNDRLYVRSHDFLWCLGYAR
jgi:hypothetical protein